MNYISSDKTMISKLISISRDTIMDSKRINAYEIFILNVMCFLNMAGSSKDIEGILYIYSHALQ